MGDEPPPDDDMGHVVVRGVAIKDNRILCYCMSA